MEWTRVEDGVPPRKKDGDDWSDMVLMTVKDKNGDYVVDVGLHRLVGSGGYWCYYFDDVTPEMYGEKVLAWAPMPKPYTKESEKYYIARWFIDGNDIPFDSVEYNENEQRYIFHFNKHAFKECDLWAVDKFKEADPYPLKPDYPKSLEEYARHK